MIFVVFTLHSIAAIFAVHFTVVFATRFCVFLIYSASEPLSQSDVSRPLRASTKNELLIQKCDIAYTVFDIAAGITTRRSAVNPL